MPCTTRHRNMKRPWHAATMQKIYPLNWLNILCLTMNVLTPGNTRYTRYYSYDNSTQLPTCSHINYYWIQVIANFATYYEVTKESERRINVTYKIHKTYCKSMTRSVIIFLFFVVHFSVEWRCFEIETPPLIHCLCWGHLDSECVCVSI